MKKNRVTRRDFVRTAMAASAAIFPMPAVAQDGNARVVVVGGGFGGAACARALKRANPRMAVTLVETNRTFTACPMSNAAIAGLRDLKLQDFATITLRQQVSARNSLLLRPSIPRRRPLPSQMGASSVTSAWYSHRASIFAGTLSRAI